MAPAQVLAMYPDTTCFYKAFVHTQPSLNLTTPQGANDTRRVARSGPRSEPTLAPL